MNVATTGAELFIILLTCQLIERDARGSLVPQNRKNFYVLVALHALKVKFTGDRINMLIIWLGNFSSFLAQGSLLCSLYTDSFVNCAEYLSQLLTEGPVILVRDSLPLAGRHQFL